MNIPNTLTILRIVLVPVYIFFLYSKTESAYLFATTAFVAAAVTDILDGHIARKYKLITNLGKVLDPVADKIMVTAAMIVLVDLDRLAAWVVIVMLFRDFAVGALRDVAASGGTIIAAGFWGKLKTILQMTSVAIIIFYHDLMLFPLFGITLESLTGGALTLSSTVTFSIPMYELGMLVMYAALAISVFSGLVYFKKYSWVMKGRV